MLIRQLRGIGWAWTAAFLAAAVVFQGIAVQLANPAWLVVPGGSAASSVHAFVPVQLLILSWAAFLVFIVWTLVSRELTRPNRVWPMIVLAALGILGAAFFGGLATDGILQLGHAALTAHAAAARLVAPADDVSAAATVAAVLSLIILPGTLAVIRRGRRSAPAKEPR